MRNCNLMGWVIVVVLVLGASTRATDDYRIFKSSGGKEVCANVLNYDADAGMVTLELAGGKRGEVPVSSLSSDDQSYILDWYESGARFLSEDLFSVTLSEKDGKWKHGIGSRFVLKLSNKSDADFDKLRIVCCEIREKDGVAGFFHFNLKTSKLPAGKTIREEMSLSSSGDETGKNSQFVIGVRMRLYWTAPDGSELIREVCVPEMLSNEKYAWKDPDPESLKITGSIGKVWTEMKKHSIRTFEYSYTIGPCKSYSTESYCEFKNADGDIKFMRGMSTFSKGPSREGFHSLEENIDAREHDIEDAELNAYWIQIYAVDVSGSRVLVAEKHEGCESLEELKERNGPPIGW